MDVTAQTFPYHLPRILDDLATCCFVSMDFEFSGIATTSSNPTRKPQSLQARYEEVKNSADKYQILQVGLTICHEDTKNGQIFSSCLHCGFRLLTWTLDSVVYFETLQRKLEPDYRPETRGGERLVHAK